MHCDLNIPIASNPDRASVDKIKLILSQLSQSSECTVALNHTTKGINKKKALKPIDRSLIDVSLLNSKFTLTILTRVTIDTDELISNDDIRDLKEKFDLVAIRTNSLDVFRLACRSYDQVDIISLHCNERIAFELSSIDINLALQRNIYFELCYAPAIRDNQARTYTLQLAKQLFEFTQGNKFIISSEAEIVSEIRDPGDIFYFAKAIGLPNDKAKFSIEKNCEQLLSSRSRPA